MFVLPIPVNTVLEQIKVIDAHKASHIMMLNKAEILPIKVYKVRTPAGNIIKQEMLSAGGECVVNKNCITCKDDFTDILLLGTVKHYKRLLEKMKLMNYFGLGQLYQLLSAYIQNHKLKTTLPHGRELTYEQMRVMGIVNITPDSFFIGSRKTNTETILTTVEQMLENGACVIDIGGESTRPGFTPISAKEELERILPAITAIRDRFGNKPIISIDTYKPDTAREALLAGADIINDINGCIEPAMREVLLKFDAPAIVMHYLPHAAENTIKNDIVQEVATTLFERTELMRTEGFNADKIIIDIGIGFGKTQQENLQLIKYVQAFNGLGYPQLLAVSRKRVLGNALKVDEATKRLPATMAITAHAWQNNVHMIRVHDVLENAHIIQMLEAVKNV